MSLADELLNSISETSELEETIAQHENVIIDKDRFIHMPIQAKKIAVQYDHDINIVTFDCPRFWDGYDLSSMNIYVNYMREDRYSDRFKCVNVVVDEDCDTIIHFDWIVSRNVTEISGYISYVVCALETNSDGVEVRHWNSEICSDAYVSDGIECVDGNMQINSDIAEMLLHRMEETYNDFVSDVNSVKSSALEEINATKVTSINELETKKNDCLAEIPEDYTNISARVELLEDNKVAYSNVRDASVVTTDGDLQKYVQLYTDDTKTSKASPIVSPNGIIDENGDKVVAKMIQDVEGLSAEMQSVVEDVTEDATGINIIYKDGNTKKVVTKVGDTIVEDITSSETGVTILYTDGSTKNIEIQGGVGGGGSFSGTASITRITPASFTCIYGEQAMITYSLTATDSAGDLVGSGAGTWYVGGIAVKNISVEQGENTFDISPYLNAGNNNIKLTVTVDTGGDTPVTVSKTWTVNSVNMYAVWDYDDSIINEDNEFYIRWTPYGDLMKTTHILIDNEEVHTSTTSRNGLQQMISLSRLSHGSHMVEMYLTAEVNGVEVRSASVFHDMVFVENGNTNNIVASSFVTNSMLQYNTVTIPIVLYTPSSITSDATLIVNDEVVANWRGIGRTIQYWNYTPSTSGEKVLKVICGDATKTFTINVEAVNINVEEVGGYAFKFKASDIAGNDALRDWNSNGVTIQFSDNFDWDNGGMHSELDEVGNNRQYMCVKAGTRAIVDYELFGNDAKVNGKNFKLIFKAHNAMDADASILNCMDSGIGISVGATSTTASSQQTSIRTKYNTEAYIELEYEIYPRRGHPYVKLYIDGVLSNAVVYSADEDNFTHLNKQKIVIGSDECDIYVYMVKVYEMNLTPDNHVDNFIVDAYNAVEMFERYERNDVLADNGEISYEKLADKNINCRVHLYDIPRMTQGKKDWVTGCRYQQIYRAKGAEHQLTANNVSMAIQGTSSVNYKDAAANQDSEFTEGFIDGNGKHIDGYAMTDRVVDDEGNVVVKGSIPVNYMNAKVNVASCEHVNNMCAVEWYDRFQPYKTLWSEKNDKARNCMELNMGVQFFKDRSHTLFSDDNYHMYSICNMGNSKKNVHVFHDADNPLECCIETLDNDSNHCMMLDPTFDIDTLDSEEFFEFRYPKSPTLEMKQAFVRLVRWFANGNPAVATDEPLSSAVTFEPYTFKGTGRGEDVLAGTSISAYAGTYTNDTYEYRMAKMLSECEDYLIMDSIVYHYLFVEQHVCLDNVTKNTFWGTEDLVHWHLVKHYDNDTCDGNENNGLLIVDFGCEGFDKLTETRDVYNGNKNVYWGFIYGLYEARRAMWINRESAGAWDKDAYIAFTKGRQSVIPERVYNQDYWYKYLRLYETKGVIDYIPKLEGGKKTHQRASFVENNYYYNASQYMGVGCTSQSITLRGYTPSTWGGVEPKSEISVSLFQDGYVVVQVANRYQRIRAKKGEVKTVVFGDGDMNDTVINIHGANIVQSLGDISCLYVGYCNFSSATRLRSVQIGSLEEGYHNDNLQSVGFGANTMLESLYIQNCPNATSVLDLSLCSMLRSVDVRGSGFSGVSFAVGGALERAFLESPTSLALINLYMLKDDSLIINDKTNIATIRLENCPNINSLRLVESIPNLTRARLIGIDWELHSVDILSAIAKIYGIDENGYNTRNSVVTGSVRITGPIKTSDINKFNDIWDSLVLRYDIENVITQFEARYVNYDGTVLYSVHVNRGDLPPDPITLGYIKTPVRPMDERYIYTYDRWSGIDNNMYSDRTITAMYLTEDRIYTVNWYTLPNMLYRTKQCLYGENCCLDDANPINERDESSLLFHLFNGWDKSTAHITCDTDVYAQWTNGSVPLEGAQLCDMTPTEIYALAKTNNLSNYVGLKDYVDIDICPDVNYSNIESMVVCENQYFDGSTAIDIDLSLFGGEYRAFTLAIDFEFTGITKDSALFSCGELDGSEGIRLTYDGGAFVTWGDTTTKVGYMTNKNRCVIRHEVGSKVINVYSYNLTGSTHELEPVEAELTRARVTKTNSIITLGAVKTSDGYTNYGTGWVNWCKVWFDDIGENDAKHVSNWVCDKWRFEYCENKFELSDYSNETSNGMFIMNNLLYLKQQMNTSNTNVNGLSGSKMDTYLNTRCYDAFPDTWKSLMKKVKVPTSAGQGLTTIVHGDYKLYIPSLVEVNNDRSIPYSNEGKLVPWFTSDLARVKFRGLIIPDDYACYNVANTDPTSVQDNTVKRGDIWRRNNLYYYYIPKEEYQKHYFANHDTANVSAANGGLWVGADIYWLRSPHASYSTYFWYVYTSGQCYSSTNNTSHASNSYGVAVCFSI